MGKPSPPQACLPFNLEVAGALLETQVGPSLPNRNPSCSRCSGLKGERALVAIYGILLSFQQRCPASPASAVTQVFPNWPTVTPPPTLISSAMFHRPWAPCIPHNTCGTPASSLGTNQMLLSLLDPVENILTCDLSASLQRLSIDR